MKDEGNVKFKIRTSNPGRLKTIEDKMVGLGWKCRNLNVKKAGSMTDNNAAKLKKLVYDNNYKNNSSLKNFKNDIQFIEKLK